MNHYDEEIEREEQRPALPWWAYWFIALGMGFVLAASAVTNDHDELQDAADHTQEVMARQTSFSSAAVPIRSTSPKQ